MWEASISMVPDGRTQTRAGGEAKHQGGPGPAGAVSSSSHSQPGSRTEPWVGLTPQGSRRTGDRSPQGVL